MRARKAASLGKACTLGLLQRIRKTGHRVTQQKVQINSRVVDIYRVDGDLALSRAIGDFRFKHKHLKPEEQAVSCIPDVRWTQRRRHEDEFIVMACDGVWDVMSSGEVCRIISSFLPAVRQGRMRASALAAHVVDLCWQRGSSDNMTLTCWFMPECQSAPLRGGTAISLSPTAKKIDEWTMTRLKSMGDNLDKYGNEEDIPEQWRVIEEGCFKMDAPKTEKKGGRAIEEANKGDVVFGFTDMVDGVKWLRTMAIAPEYGQPVIAYILIEGDVLGLPITIEKVDGLVQQVLVVVTS